MHKKANNKLYSRYLLRRVATSVVLSSVCFYILCVLLSIHPFLSSCISFAVSCPVLRMKDSSSCDCQEKKIKNNLEIQVFIVGTAFGLTTFWFFRELLWMSSLISFLIGDLVLHLFLLTVYALNAKKAPYLKMNLRGYAYEILLLISAFVLPQILLLHFCANNVQYYELSSTILLGVFLSFISLLVFLLFSQHTESAGALYCALFLSVAFWLYPALHKIYPAGVIIFFILTVIAILLYILSLHTPDHLIGAVLSVVIITLFSYNLFGAIIHTSAYSKSGNSHYQLKSTFFKDKDAGHPNIYWFHMDGMMGFQAVEAIFQNKQESLVSDLTERGFIIKPDASLDIGWTAYAIPALTSPTFYESYLQPLMASMPGMTDTERKHALGDNTNIYSVYPKLELFQAFEFSGYQVYHLLFDIGRYFEKIPMLFSPDNDYSQDRKVNLVELLAEHSMLSIFGDALHERFSENIDLSEKGTEYQSKIYEYIDPNSEIQIYSLKHYDWYMANAFENAMNSNEPRLVYIQNFIPHCSYRFDENGIAHQTLTAHDMDKYLPQHRFAAKLTMGMIDRILEEDPDSVIVIQADHGVHAFDKSELYPQGYSDDQMLEMNYSTISAVRIPEKYGSLTEPLDPLDITRYLVNHFVGKGNYDYLYYHEEE